MGWGEDDEEATWNVRDDDIPQALQIDFPSPSLRQRGVDSVPQFAQARGWGAPGETMVDVVEGGEVEAEITAAEGVVATAGWDGMS